MGQGILLALAWGAAAALAAGPSADYSKPQTEARLPDGRRVVPMEAWGRAQPIIAQRRRTCAFDQLGYRFSDLPARAITAASTAADLRQALAASQLAAPYILVAHSRAGYDARQFAHLYPKATAGLVLLDVNADFDLSPATKAKIAGPSDSDACIRAAADGRLTPESPLFARCGSPRPGSPALIRIVRAKSAG